MTAPQNTRGRGPGAAKLCHYCAGLWGVLLQPYIDTQISIVLRVLKPPQEHTLGFFFLPAPGAFRRKRPELFGISAEAPPLRPFHAGAVEQIPFARRAQGGRGRGCWREPPIERNVRADAKPTPFLPAGRRGRTRVGQGRGRSLMLTARCIAQQVEP